MDTVRAAAQAQAHDLKAEVDKLRTPLKDFPVTYWDALPDAFYVPCQALLLTIDD